MSPAFNLALVAACAFIGAIGAMLAGFKHVALWLSVLGAVTAFAGAFAARRRP